MTRNAEMYNPMRAYLTVHIPPPPRPLPPGAQDPTVLRRRGNGTPLPLLGRVPQKGTHPGCHSASSEGGRLPFCRPGGMNKSSRNGSPKPIQTRQPAGRLSGGLWRGGLGLKIVPKEVL